MNRADLAKLLLTALATFIIIAGVGRLAFANTPGQHSVSLTWTEASCPACTFNVYRSLATGVCSGTPTPYATGVTSTSFKDTAVTGGTTYFYAVSAVSGGESACSAEAQAAVPSSPSAPTGLQGTAQ